MQQFSLRGRPGLNTLCERHLATTFRGLSQIPSSAGEAAPARLFSQHENRCTPRNPL